MNHQILGFGAYINPACETLIDMMNTRNKFELSCNTFATVAKTGKAMDSKSSAFVLAGKKCAVFYLEGFLNKQALERVLGAFENTDEDVWKDVKSASQFVNQNLFFAECVSVSFEDAVLRLLSGFLILLFEGYEEEFLAVEARITPQRSIQEPTKGKTLRGPHEGYCENIVTNLALLRRRIKTPDLMVKEFTVGTLTQTRIGLCYLEGVADEKIVRDAEEKIKKINLKAFSMGEETLTERLFYRKGPSLFNPLPRARFTERPDTCAAELCEGKLVILIDTTPNAIILPMTFFDYFEECDNYYFPPMTATYLKIVRFFSLFCGIYLVPIWLCIIKSNAKIPESFSFLLVTDPYAVPIFLQLLLIEVAIDALKLASLNTPEPLANSLSVVGGLLLGEFAVRSGWFVPQTILYSAIATILNFIPNNYELGYSLKFFRILLLIFSQLFGALGLLIGSSLIVFALANMKDASGKGYLYPLFPFHKKGFVKIFVKTLKGKESA